MKIYVLIFLVVIASLKVSSENLPKAPNFVSVKHETGLGGTWKTKVEWKASWVKYWEVKKMYIPTWKKVWSPIEVREWIPLPKPPTLIDQQQHH